MSNSQGRQPASAKVDQLARIAVDSVFRVHKELGPGLLESVYSKCLLFELHSRNIAAAEAEVPLPVLYRGCRIDAGLRLDLLVDGELIIELKAVDQLHDVHKAQMLTYLKLANKQLGLLVNFNVPLIKDGIRRIIN